MSSEEISSTPKTNEIISTADQRANHVEDTDAKLKEAGSGSCNTGQSSLKDDLPISDKKNRPQRCHKCRKKVGLTGLDCRCGNVYCALHRYSNEHDCPFDYKAHGAEEIKKNNPAIIAPKISKI